MNRTRRRNLEAIDIRLHCRILAVATVLGACLVFSSTSGAMPTAAAEPGLGGQTGPPTLSVSPTSGPPGTVVNVSGRCAPTIVDTTATLTVVLETAAKNPLARADASGPGPIIQLTLTIPFGTPSGVYTLAATCEVYTGLAEFTPATFTVPQPPPPPTTTAPPTTAPTTTAPRTTVVPPTVTPPQTTPKITSPTTTTTRQTTTTTSLTATTSTSTTSTTTPPTSPMSSTTSPTALLRLDRPSAPPGGTVVAHGEGCLANTLVALLIDGTPAGDAPTNSSGSFTTRVRLEGTVGRHTITAVCGVTLTAPIEVVLSSEAGLPTTTVAILLALLLAVVGLTHRQLLPDHNPSSRPTSRRRNP
jgi:hypothetical protein